MTIFVDDLRAYAGKRGLWCHMAADGDLRELHLMARKIALKPSWFQARNPRHPHYDLVPSKRALAIKLGAVAVDSMTLVKACFPIRPMPTGELVGVAAHREDGISVLKLFDQLPGNDAYEEMLSRFQPIAQGCIPGHRSREWWEQRVQSIARVIPGLYPVEILYHLIYNLSCSDEEWISSLAGECWDHALTLEEINDQRRELCDYCFGAGRVDGFPCAGCQPWE